MTSTRHKSISNVTTKSWTVECVRTRCASTWSLQVPQRQPNESTTLQCDSDMTVQSVYPAHHRINDGPQRVPEFSPLTLASLFQLVSVFMKLSPFNSVRCMISFRRATSQRLCFVYRYSCFFGCSVFIHGSNQPTRNHEPSSNTSLNSIWTGPYFASTTTEFNSHARRISLDEFKVHPSSLFLLLASVWEHVKFMAFHLAWTIICKLGTSLANLKNLHRKKLWNSGVPWETLDLIPRLKTCFLAFFKLSNSSGLGLIGKDEVETKLIFQIWGCYG